GDDLSSPGERLHPSLHFADRRQPAMDEHERLALAVHLVIQLDPVHIRVAAGRRFHLCLTSGGRCTRLLGSGTAKPGWYARWHRPVRTVPWRVRHEKHRPFALRKPTSRRHQSEVYPPATTGRATRQSGERFSYVPVGERPPRTRAGVS